LTGSTFPDPTEVIPTAFGGADPGAAYTTPPPASDAFNNSSNQVEATLDVERAGSVAPGANLLVVANAGIVETSAQYLVNTAPVPAQVMSVSFTTCESEIGASGVSYWDTLFQQAAAEGISVFVGAGDSGASGCDVGSGVPPASPLPNSPNAICSSSYVTCVGGTEFNDAGNPTLYWNSSNGPGLSSALGYIPEGAWNDSYFVNPDGLVSASVTASGGGVSAYIPTPSWQAGTGVPAAMSGRYTPDVSFSASCNYAYLFCYAAGLIGCTNATNFGGQCGTSSTAPDMAGVAALLEQQLGTQGNMSPALYQMAASAPAAFHDVTVATSGVTDCDINVPSMCNNSIPGPTGLSGGQAGYLVGPGYDEVTGLGSLDVATFIANYPSGPRPAKIAFDATNLTFLDQPIGVPSAVQTLGMSDTGTAPLNPPTITIIGLNASDFSQTNNCQPPTYTGGACSIQVTFTPSLYGNRTAILMVAAGNASNSPQTVALIGTATGVQAPTVAVYPSLYYITTTQALTATVLVSGVSGYPTPTGTVTLTSGSFTSTPATLSNGSATLNIPAGSLATGPYTIIDALYTPDASSSPTYLTSGGNAFVSVTAAPSGATAPTVTVAPSSSSIATTQGLTVTVAVSGGSSRPTPTGTLTLTSGFFNQSQVPLTNGSGTFNIAAGSLAIGTDTLIAGYAPDSASSATYTSSSGSGSVSVSGPVRTTPSVTVTPSSSSITATQGLTVAVAVSANPAPTGTATLISGNFATVPFTLANGAATIAIVAGSLATGTDPLTVIYTPDSSSSSIYNSSTGISSVTVTLPPQAITFTTPVSPVTYGVSPIALSATATSGLAVTFSVVSGPGTVSGNILTITGAGTIIVAANQAGNANYAAAGQVTQSIVVNAASQTINFTTPVSPVTYGVSPIALSATATSGLAVTFSVVSGPGTVSGNILTITGAGTIVVAANQAGNANYAAAGQVTRSIVVNQPIDAAIELQFANTQLVYPSATNVTVCVAPATRVTATGSVKVYDGTTLLTTLVLQGNGCAYWLISPGLSAGTHVMTAVYSGDSHNPSGTSAATTLTVSPVPVNMSVTCSNTPFAYGANYQCTVSLSSKAGAPLGSITYRLDSGSAVTLPLRVGNAQFALVAPAAGNHNVVVAYAQQTNYAAAAPRTETFTVTPAAVNVALTPSSWNASAGANISFAAAVTSWNAAPPDAAGSVSFYDGATLLSTVAVNASGHATYSTAHLSAGTHIIKATYSGSANYASGSTSVTIVLRAGS
jgi:hypothetical protein